MKGISVSFNKKFYTNISFYLFLLFIGIAIFRYNQLNSLRLSLLALIIVAQGAYAFINIKKMDHCSKNSPRKK
ncbi:hypothetical protein G8J22_00116 [Lentilactobacillus hilgardii]|nr:hypothetical protein HMPREF0497_0387 [Lentilactobacillus buchneri ATCC 11577]MCT3395089.1 hypothetical protein [Lentilactobacillus hilgardii]QIR08182.1 hypothetical protein G8J22_00116 [Lentilactobacillus hilgardii]